MITTKTLEKSKHFNSLDGFKKNILLKNKNLEHINLGLNMSNLKGFDFWVKKCSPSETNKIIVKELIDDKRRQCSCWLENKTCKCEA